MGMDRFQFTDGISDSCSIQLQLPLTCLRVHHHLLLMSYQATYLLVNHSVQTESDRVRSRQLV